MNLTRVVGSPAMLQSLLNQEAAVMERLTQIRADMDKIRNPDPTEDDRRMIAVLELVSREYTPVHITTKINNIKLVRAVSGLGLKEAKDWVETFARHLY